MPADLSPGALTRALVVAAAALFAVLGVVLLAAPDWAATRFAWVVPPFVAATMGGWSIGNAVIAGLTARMWRWPTVRSALLYLWLFAAGQLAVLVAFADDVVLGGPLAWLYLGALTVTALSALTGVVDLVRNRPSSTVPGRPVPGTLRTFLVAVIAFDVLLAGYLAVAAPGGSAAAGRVFPVELGLFSVRAFAAFFGALALAAIPLIASRTVEPVLHFSRCALALIVPIMAAAALYGGVFDLTGRPGQWLYLGAYAAVGIAIVVALVGHRRSAGGPGSAPGARRASAMPRWDPDRWRSSGGAAVITSGQGAAGLGAGTRPPTPRR